ncbi:MAG: hypothetical protein KKA60_01950 [Proteobacteria bacterium]|nr:hypothetical protein [Pseudomonadota bacterium]
MRIGLDLSRHCVETEARRLYEKALRQALAPDGLEAWLEARVEALADFLEHADHRALRASDPVLSGAAGGKAVLVVHGPGSFSLEMGDRTLAVPLG